MSEGRNACNAACTAVHMQSRQGAVASPGRSTWVVAGAAGACSRGRPAGDSVIPSKPSKAMSQLFPHCRAQQRGGMTGGEVGCCTGVAAGLLRRCIGSRGICRRAHLLHHVLDRLSTEGGKHLGQGFDRGRGSHGGSHQTCRQRGVGGQRGGAGVDGRRWVLPGYLHAGCGLSALYAGQCCHAPSPAAWVGPAGHH